MDPRPAATLVLARPGTAGPEVLVLRRAAGSRFAPGYVVFPGGAIEPEDNARAAAWFGSAEESARACAVRELAEEAGLVMVRSGIRPVEDGGDLTAIDADPPPRTALVEMARWIAPEFLATRFDARFFAAEADEPAGPRPDGVEVESARWARPADVLEAERLWETLMWPTFCTLEALAGCASVEEILRLRVRPRRPPPELEALRSPEWGGSRGGGAA